MKRWFGLVLAACMVIGLIGCSSSAEKSNNEKLLGISLGNAAIEEVSDSHGGFLGDGASLRKVDAKGLDLAAQIEKAEHWQALPLSENVNELLYGVSEDGYVSTSMLADKDGKSIMPEVKNGSYFFYDRHSEAENAYDDSDVFSRASLNCTIAVYDADADILYLVTLDT